MNYHFRVVWNQRQPWLGDPGHAYRVHKDRGTEGQREGRYKRVADGRHADQPIGKQVLENMLEGSSQSELVLLLPVSQVAELTGMLCHTHLRALFFSHINILPSVVHLTHCTSCSDSKRCWCIEARHSQLLT